MTNTKQLVLACKSIGMSFGTNIGNVHMDMIKKTNFKRLQILSDLYPCKQHNKHGVCENKGVEKYWCNHCNTFK